MIDVHSHLLPFVDDGSDSIETSLYLLKQCENYGVTDVILTPHYKVPYKKTPDEIKEVFDKLNTLKTEQGISVNLYLGSEIHDSKNLKKYLAEKKVLTLNGTNYVLIEFDYFKKTDVTETIYSLVHNGYVPIVAHVERYEYVTLGDIYEIKSLGGLIQINASSITRDAKRKTRRKVKKLFKLSLVDFVASDAHAERHNAILEAYKFVSKKFGNAVAEKVFVKNAKTIIGQA